MIKVFEAFSGIGTQRMALRNLGIEHEVVAIAEIDKYALKSYEAIHEDCPNLGDISKIETTDIPDHRVEERRRYDKYQRSKDVNKKYGRAWKKIRARYVAAHPLCEMCQAEGRLTPTEIVHHIKELSDGGTHDFSNLMSVCKSCHNKIHLELGDRQIRS